MSNISKEQEASRRRAHAFKAERQANFAKNVRKSFLVEGRHQKDVERQRMEAYRKLCAQEGIQSQRLAEYDKTKEAVTKSLAEALEKIDYDQSLTNNEKKRRKFNLKRKFAATSVVEQMGKAEAKYNSIAAAEIIGEKRRQEQELKQKEREERAAERQKRTEARRSRNALYAKRTKKGQPVLATRVQSLLSKLQQEEEDIVLYKQTL